MDHAAAAGPAPPAIDSDRTARGWRRWLPRDPYPLAAWLTFASIVVCNWVGFVDADEEIYLLGSRRLADPGLLANDITWSRLSPTTALYDHMLAPLWRFLDAFAIVNLGRFAFWALMAWAVVRLAKQVRLPAWSVVAGFTVWMLWKQTLGTCGSPFQGFQPKSFAYPLLLMSLVSALRGHPGRAGLAAGLATAFHIVVGGWACLALFLSLLVHRDPPGWRPLARYLAGAAAIVAPVLAVLFAFRTGSVPAADQARMSEVYALFAMPHCCDPDVFLSPERIPFAWLRAGVVFAAALWVVYSWPERRAARRLGTFLAALIAFWLAGVGARRLGAYGLLTLYPFQLANALPAMFLFVFHLGGLGRRVLLPRARRATEVALAAGVIGLALDGGVPAAIVGQPQVFGWEIANLSIVSPTMNELDPLYAWIRGNTPRNSVFVTPLIQDFWPYAERAQVASMRQPPLDHAILEWERRLIDLNGGRPFAKRGFETEVELERHQAELTPAQLVRMREHYGATHYLVHRERPDLAAHLLHHDLGWYVYDVTGMSAAE